MDLPEPRVARIENDRGVVGATIQVSLIGTTLDGVIQVSISGSGAKVRMLGPPQSGRIELEIDIAANAAPGPRLIRLEVASRLWTTAVFHVLPRLSYAGTSGIGSHLI